jgi:NAD(P)-dependent dehydrogenase (short-subunit alcohol dehydrogenase family)
MSSLTAELNGRAALVLGGSDGIGYAVADELGVAGAEVTVADGDEAALERVELRLGVRTHRCDFSVPAEAAVEAVEAARVAQGRLDLLVCAQARRPSTHLGATMATIAAAAAAMTGDGGEGGRIVVVTAANAAGGGEGFEAEQLELRRRVRAAAVELAPRRVAVNAVVPGWVRTPDFEADPPASETGLNPVGVVAEPADVSRAVLWLLDPANVLVAGAELAVDGGQGAAASG